ncbi:MAG: metallophosphatase family protein [Sterolibacteriaceae bacterium]|uniref:Metallophosphatase family protein n=1 Tax=Candidatus Methylophosphatis roskildensis TaxID=2899263 RepID=A0A9D7E2P3_9PROT|nr:metallophosphatase family protein [Candidatus Methylophosphatis roskildensis]
MTIQSTVRVCQMSDLHYSGKNLAESERCFAFAVDRAIAAGPDCVVISGDSTDHALDAHAPAFAALARNLRRLADHCPVLMLQGTFSHEPPGTLAVFGLLGGRYPVMVADRIKQVALLPSGTWAESDGWRFDGIPDGTRLLVSCIPTVNKGAVAAVVGATQAAEALGAEMANLLRALAPGHRDARASGIPTAVVSHGTVSGCTTEHGVPMAGLDHEFTTGSLFAAETSAVMLGHIHRHQIWESGHRLIAYAGSIGRFHYGEEGDKGMLMWEVGPEGASAVLDPTPARRTIEVSFAGAPDLDELRAIAADAQGAFVKVRWEIGEEERASVDRAAIEAALTGAAEVKLEGRIVPVVRSRAAGISKAGTLHDKLQQWASVVGADPAPLSATLAKLESGTPEAIAAAILATAAPLPETLSAAQASVAAVPVPAVPGPEPESELRDLFG